MYPGTEEVVKVVNYVSWAPVSPKMVSKLASPFYPGFSGRWAQGPHPLFFSVLQFVPVFLPPQARPPIPIVNPHTIVCVHWYYVYVLFLIPSPSLNLSPPPPLPLRTSLLVHRVAIDGWLLPASCDSFLTSLPLSDLPHLLPW